jgi:Family of unknown function (DUF6492)
VSASPLQRDPEPESEISPGTTRHAFASLSALTTLAVLTPSYAPDYELCRDLNRSVLAFTPSEVHHHIIVPARDRGLFASLQGTRTELWTVDQFVPRRMLALPDAVRRMLVIPPAKYLGRDLWINLRRPYPPIDGWLMQQVVKLRAAIDLGADVVLLADSDVALVRPVTVDTLCQDGQVHFYREPDVVDHSRPEHVTWHRVARRLLGLPADMSLPQPDYISAFNVWDRTCVTALRDRIEEVNRRPWLDAIGACRHNMSEFILYGVFVEELMGASAAISPTSSTLCHSYWETTPLSEPAARRFVRGRKPQDVAVMISAKSYTPLEVRRAALAEVMDGRAPAPD